MTGEHLFKELAIDWSSSRLLDIMFSYPQKMWNREEGISNRYLRISDDYISGLMSQLVELGYNPQNSFFAEMLPGTQLPVHTDFSRSNAVNFPLVGEWQKSPLNFFTADGKEIRYTYYYQPAKAVWINTQVPHSVINQGNKSRFILSISLYEQ